MFSIAGPGWIVDDLDAVVFDKDGTLIDLHAYWGEVVRRRARSAMARFDVGEGEFQRLCASMGLSLADGRIAPDGPVGLAPREEVVRALRVTLCEIGVDAAEAEVVALFAEVHDAFLPDLPRFLSPLPGVLRLIERLRAVSARIAVVTSDTTANTRRTLAALGLESCVDVVVGRDIVSEPKMRGEPARYALAALRAMAAHTVCIGDAPMDLMMAVHSGCRGIGVASGQTPIGGLRDHTEYVASSLEDLTCLERP